MSRNTFLNTPPPKANRDDVYKGVYRKPNSWPNQTSYFLRAFLMLPIIFQLLPAANLPERSHAQGIPNSLIVFVRDGNIWVIHPDGSGEQQITRSDGYSDPALSPDGSQIAFIKGFTIGVLDLEDKHERVIVLAEKTPFALLDTYYTFSLPRWSPDGKSLYFIASDGRVQGDSIRKVEVESGIQVRGIVLHPRGLDVSPRSAKLAYVTFSNAPPEVGNGLEVVDSDGSNARQVLPIRDVGINDLCWTWDETNIIFSEITTSGGSSLKLIKVDQGDSFILEDVLNVSVSRVACSPQDNSLVYESNGTLYVYETETQATRILARGSQPSWELQNAAQTQDPCGNWEWVGPKEKKDLRITTTQQSIDSTDDCAGVFHLENNTGYSIWGYALGEYTLELRSTVNNASTEWKPDEHPPYGYIYLIPNLIQVLKTVPNDPTLEASVQVRGNLSMDSLKMDLAYFLIKTLADIVPCIPEDKILIGAINVANTDILDPVVKPLLKWPPDMKKAASELELVWDNFWKEALVDIAGDCVEESLERLLTLKVKLLLEVNIWWIRIIENHYIRNNWGEDAIVDLQYTPIEIVQPTEIIIFQPSGVAGQELSGSCWTLSIASPRDGAWRCMSDSRIFDPCFSPPGETGYVICGALPFGNTRGLKLNLIEPLPIETLAVQTSSILAVELEDGTTCQFLTTGTLFEVEGKYYNYSCSDGSILLDVEPGEVWIATQARLSSDHSRILETAMVRIKIVWI